MASIYWLLSDEVLQLRTARSLGRVIVARGRASSPAVEEPSPLTVADGVATIRVEGVLTPTPDDDAAWFGEANTLYPDLQAALSSALANEDVSEIVWSIDSPGGSVDGYFALLDDIADARASGGKPMRVQAENAHSAAYGIAAAAGPITATDRMSSFGSVGVATSAFVLGKMIGETVHLTSSDAPEKRPDVATPEGRAVVTRYLDQLAAEFMGAIATGRGVKVEDVAAGFGRGSSALANTALAMGLIDAVAPRARGRNLTDANGRANVRNMATEPTAPEQAPAVTALDVADAIPVDVDLSALTALAAADQAELATLRAERDARVAAERRTLVTALVEIGAETPATAWSDGAPTARLAAEPLDDLRTRVAALRAAKPASSHTPPPAGTGQGEEQLTDFERRDAAKIKDPDARARFVASRIARKQKAQ
jgi:ClpP class serine protease